MSEDRSVRDELEKIERVDIAMTRTFGEVLNENLSDLAKMTPVHANLGFHANEINVKIPRCAGPKVRDVSVAWNVPMSSAIRFLLYQGMKSLGFDPGGMLSPRDIGFARRSARAPRPLTTREEADAVRGESRRGRRRLVFTEHHDDSGDPPQP